MDEVVKRNHLDRRRLTYLLTVRFYSIFYMLYKMAMTFKCEWVSKTLTEFLSLTKFLCHHNLCIEESSLKLHGITSAIFQRFT